MDAPQWFKELIANAVKHNAEAGNAVVAAIAAFWGHEGHEDFVKDLAERAIRRSVWEERLAGNVRFKAEAFAKEPRPVPVVSEAANGVYQSVYDYAIGSRVLGDLTGDELPRLRDNCLSAANAKLADAGILGWLMRRVKGRQRVRDKVSERALEREFRQIWKECHAKPQAEAG